MSHKIKILPHCLVICIAAIAFNLTHVSAGFTVQISRQPETNNETINLNLQNVSLKNTLQLLCRKLNKNLLMDPEINDLPLNMNFSKIKPEDAFAAILQASGLSYKELEGNVYYVSTAEKIGDQTIVKNITCKYANAEDLAKILTRMISTDIGAVMADKRTNTLIIKERPEIISKMQHLIQKLDRSTKQIYIQAEIVEISSTDGKELGVEWLWKTANIKSIDGHVGTDFNLRNNQLNVSDQTGQTQVTKDFPFPTGSGLGIGILNTDFEGVLHALAEKNNVNLISRPRIVTMDNQESVIEVGDQIPFKRLNQFGVTSFEFKDATVQLTVRPHIIDSSFVLLQVAPKADFQNGFTPDGTPIISTRRASTNVKVRNGQTIVIGGLIRDSSIENQKKVPILGDIPLLGHLFKSTVTSKVKTELIVFITPKILADNLSPKTFQKDFRTKSKLQKAIGLN